MYVAIKDNLEHYKNWKCSRLGVIMRLNFGDSVAECSVTKLRFGKDSGTFKVPVPDIAAGQVLYLEAIGSGELARVNGESLTFADNRLTLGGTVLVEGSASVRLTGVFQIGGGFCTGSTVTATATSFAEKANTIEAINQLEITDKVAVVEIHDKREKEVRYTLDVLDCAVFNRQERDKLLFNSGVSPSVGQYGQVEVTEAPSNLMAVEFTFSEELQTLKFSHIVGMSDIGIQSAGVENSVEHLTLLLFYNMAFVMLAGEVVGKFRFEAGQKMMLANVFNVKLYDGNIAQTDSVRHYVCSDNLDDQMDVTSYRIDRKYDFAKGTASDGAATSLVIPAVGELVEGEAACIGVRQIRNSNSYSLISYQDDGVKVVVSVATTGAGANVTFNKGGVVAKTSQLAKNQVAGRAFNVVFFGGKVYVVSDQDVVSFGVGDVTDITVEAGTVLELLTYVANSPVVPDWRVTLPNWGQGNVSEYGRPLHMVGDFNIELPQSAFKELDDFMLDNADVVARFNAMYAEARQSDATPIDKSEVVARFNAMYAEARQADATPIDKSEVFAMFNAAFTEVTDRNLPDMLLPAVTAWAKFYGVITGAPYDGKDMTDLTLPLYGSSGSKFYGVITGAPYDDKDMTDLTLPLYAARQVHFYGIITWE